MVLLLPKDVTNLLCSWLRPYHQVSRSASSCCSFTRTSSAQTIIPRQSYAHCSSSPPCLQFPCYYRRNGLIKVMYSFWEALSEICSRTTPHPASQVNRLCISPDKRFLAAAGHHTVKLYDIKSTNPAAVLTFEGHTNNITGLAFHCEGKWMVTSSEDGTVKIWDTRSGHVQRNYSHGVPVNDVVIHPNQGELISCDRGGNVRIWDLAENKCSHQLIPEEDKAVASVTVASDGSLLCAAVSNSQQGAVYVWRIITNKDVTTLVPVTKFKAHDTYITRVLLSPD